MIVPGISFISTGGGKGQPGRDGKPGQDGVPGKDGRDGAPGEAGTAGRPGKSLNWLGAWDKDRTYFPGDAVSFLKSSYICIKECKGTMPTTPSAWDVLAAGGQRGPGGGNGAPGQSIVGPQGLTWRGAYSSGTSYAKNDAVRFNGSSYIALRITVGDTPNISPLDWDLLAEKGDDGDGGGGGDSNIDGGFANSVYTPPQHMDGGGA